MSFYSSFQILDVKNLIFEKTKMFKYIVLLFILDGILLQLICNIGNHRGRMFFLCVSCFQGLVQGLRKMAYNSESTASKCTWDSGWLCVCKTNYKKTLLTSDSCLLMGF